MTFHTYAFRTTSFGTTANTKVNALADARANIRNNNYFLSEPGKVVFAYAGSGDPVRARLVSPQWQAIAQPQIRPVSSAILPPTPPPVADYRKEPLMIKPNQDLSVEATDGTGSTVAVAVLGIEQGFTPAPSGNPYTIRATSVTAAVAGTWTEITLTFDDILPPGKYAIVGMNYVAANAIAARSLISGQYWCPGCIGAAAADQLPHAMFSKGGLGLYGIFDNTTPPQVEVFNNSTDAVHTVFFDVIPMGV